MAVDFLFFIYSFLKFIDAVGIVGLVGWRVGGLRVGRLGFGGWFYRFKMNEEG